MRDESPAVGLMFFGHTFPCEFQQQAEGGMVVVEVEMPCQEAGLD
jgi:hypothetical protein